MRIKYENLKLNQSEIANQLGYSNSTLQRYRNDRNMLSPHRIPPNNTIKRTKKVSKTNFVNNSHRDHDLKRPRLTSKGLKLTSNESSLEVKPLKGGGKSETNDGYLDEILHNNNH